MFQSKEIPKGGATLSEEKGREDGEEM